MMQTVSSRNLFIDTSEGLSDQPGDNTTIHLSGNGVHASDGQIVRLSLMAFNMYRNFHSINTNNSKATIEINGLTAKAAEIQMSLKNYGTCGDICGDFADQVKTSILSLVQSETASSATVCTVLDAFPEPTATMSSTGDRIMSFNLSFDQAHNVTSFKLQCFSSVGESYAILGGNRLPTGSTDSSFECTVVSTTVLRVQGLYPMQRHSEAHVFLRTDLSSSNIETASLASSSGPYSSHTLGSNILGMFELDTEYIHFTSSTDSEFSIVLTQRNLSSLRLYLTDSKNRPLGRASGSSNQTAAGLGLAQSTLGNLSFTAMIRIDIMQFSVPRGLQTTFTRPTNAKNTGVLMEL